MLTTFVFPCQDHVQGARENGRKSSRPSWGARRARRAFAEDKVQTPQLALAGHGLPAPPPAHVHAAPSRRSSAHLSPPPPGPEGPVVTSPEATMRRHLEGNVVFRETAKSGDCIKVNTIYLHLLSLGLTKGHHRQAHPPAQL